MREHVGVVQKRYDQQVKLFVVLFVDRDADDGRPVGARQGGKPMSGDLEG